MDVVGRLRLEIIRKKLDAEIFVNNCGTIDLCDIGPNMVIYPDNVIYHGVTVKDLKEIVEHLKGGPVVERLVLNAQTPGERARHDFYQAVVDAGVTMPAGEFETLASSHDYDGAWIAEQQRRGFIARKPGADGGPETITVTSKARTRYSV